MNQTAAAKPRHDDPQAWIRDQDAMLASWSGGSGHEDAHSSQNTLKQRSSQLNVLLRWLRARSVDLLTASEEDLVQFALHVEGRSRSGPRKRTAYSYLLVASQLFRHLTRIGARVGNPAAAPFSRIRATGPLQRSTLKIPAPSFAISFRKLLQQMLGDSEVSYRDLHLAACASLMIDAGLTKAEVLSLQEESIRWSKGKTRAAEQILAGGEGQIQPRLLELSDLSSEYLTRVAREAEDGTFHSPTTSHLHDWVTRAVAFCGAHDTDGGCRLLRNVFISEQYRLLLDPAGIALRCGWEHPQSHAMFCKGKLLLV